ncbi:MAG: CPBP family intramembrane glutamic endopeptidase [Acidimicrobiales bacterium]
MGEAAGWAAAILATAAAAFLVAWQPGRGARAFARLREALATDPTARLRFYRRSIASKWVLTAIVVGIGALAAASGHDVGLPPASSRADRGAAWLVTVELLVLVPATLLVLRMRKPRIERLVDRQVGHLWPILPVGRAERRAFVGVAITAGITEEVIYRWGGITYLRWLAPGSSDLVLIVVLGAAFGLVHWYQGKVGVLLTGGFGALAALLTLQSGSLVPAVLVHCAIDLRIVGLRPVWLPTPDPPPPPPPPSPPETDPDVTEAAG